MLILFSFLIILNLQITKELRDKNPAFFKNQRIFHSAPKPLFKNRNHTLDFVTDLPSDSIKSATLYFKTDSMSYFREFELEGTFGKYQFVFEHEVYAGSHLQYYFIIKTKDGIHGTPVNERGWIIPTNNLLIDPKEYFKQKKRLNR